MLINRFLRIGKNMENAEQSKKVSDQVKQIWAELGEVIYARNKDSFLEMMQEANSWARDMLEKYPDARKLRAFHILIGSSPPAGVKEGDFPGDDSILSFVKRLREKYLEPRDSS